LVPCDGIGDGPDREYFTQWYIAPGANPSVMIVNSNAYTTGNGTCLDAGSTPTNNGPAKTWQCYPGAPQQK
jgi:hypothetical protein